MAHGVRRAACGVRCARACAGACIYVACACTCMCVCCGDAWDPWRWSQVEVRTCDLSSRRS
eukprot:7148485-Prymnesium_polylepis.1